MQGAKVTYVADDNSDDDDDGDDDGDDQQGLAAAATSLADQQPEVRKPSILAGALGLLRQADDVWQQVRPHVLCI